MDSIEKRGRIYLALFIAALVLFDLLVKGLYLAAGSLRWSQAIGTLITLAACWLLWRGSRGAYWFLMVCLWVAAIYAFVCSSRLPLSQQHSWVVLLRYWFWRWRLRPPVGLRLTSEQPVPSSGVRPHLMHVERLVASDVPRYRELMLHAYAAAPDAFTSTPEERSAEPDSWWLKRIADPSGQSLAWGAFHDSQLVGTVTVEFAVKPKTRHKAKLIGMFVHESCRGLGAGAKLVQAGLAAAKARPEVRVLTLTVTQGNAPAIGLYERCGFRQFGVEPMAIATPEGYKSKVHMWLPLGEAGAA